MKVLFVGSGAFGLPTLAQLVKSNSCVGVVTSPDKPAGRNRSMTPTKIATFAIEHDLLLLRTDDINSDESQQWLDGKAFDILVVIAFGQKLSDELTSKYRAINLHASLLPRWRGAAPIHAAIVHGDHETGISVITLASQMDAGLVLAQTSTTIGEQETTGELHDRLAQMGPSLIEEVLDGEFSGDEQPESQVTCAPKLSREDAILDLNLTADEIARKIRGFSPWPGCHLYFGEIDCKIMNAVAVDGEGAVGEILENSTIAVGQGAISIMTLKPAGSGAMGWKDFCNGRSIQVGDRCEATP